MKTRFNLFEAKTGRYYTFFIANTMAECNKLREKLNNDPHYIFEEKQIIEKRYSFRQKKYGLRF